ncbi:proteinase inhibitor I4 serpin-like protein, partial [Leptotrombidium deliense]
MRLFFLLISTQLVFAKRGHPPDPSHRHSYSSSSSKSKTQSLEMKSFHSGINGFSDDFLKQMEYKTKNVVFTPLGLSMALGMVLEGATGKMSDDIYKMLNIGNFSNSESIHNIFKTMMNEYKSMAKRYIDSRNATLELANLVLWSDSQSLPTEFTNKLKSHYEAS